VHNDARTLFLWHVDVQLITKLISMKLWEFQ
jgi:hypothetical protein